MGQQADNTSLRRDSCGRVVVTALAAAVRRWLVRPLRWLPASRFVQPCRQRATLQVEGLELRALLDATVVISEIVASNRHGLLDYDDARSDWLELFNPRTESVDLSGYSLSDDAGDLQKWGFPQDTVLDAGQRLVIFASGKDGVLPNGEIHTNFKLASGGEPLMLVEPDGETVVWQFDTTTGGVPGFPSQREDIAYGPAPTETPTTLVGSDADVAYLVPTSADAIDGDWMTNGFADPQGVWTSAPMGNGVGYDAGGPADELPSDVSFNSLIRTDVMGEMRGSNASVFVRSEFTVASPHMLDEPMLRVRYDDGFVAYLNGQQIARRSAPVDPAWNATATDRRDDAAAIRYEEIPLAAGARLRDFNGTADGIFVVDVPNGSYRVKVFLGDLVKRREQMAVLIEGDQREVLDTEASQFAVREYRADVVDGQLTLRLEKQGGPTTNVVISALEVVSETPDGPHWRFDFGTFDSPVFPGYQQVTPASTYTVSSGYGWLGGRILANDRSPSLAPADLLLAGRNVLAIQGLNVSATDDDALLQVELTAFQQGVDATRFEFFAVPTPGQPNAQGRLAVAEAPQFSSQGGTFVEPFSVTLSTDVPGGMIHYTLDETLPTLDGPVYDPDVPLEITGTTQVRAIVAATGYVTSPVVTETYVRLGDDLVDFTSPIPILVLDSLDVAPFPTRPFPINAFQSSYWAIFEPQGEQRQSSLNQPPDFQTRVGAQMRGNSSAGFPRKSFRLEAWDQYDRDLDVSPLGLPADADWILNARSEFDRSLMNNAFMYALSNESGLPAVRTRFVEVFVNMDQGELTSDDYLGVYALMEKVKRGEQRVAVEKLSKNYRTEPLVTGGYIVNLELEAQYREFGFAAGGRDRFQYVEPSADEMLEPIREPQVNYIKNYMERVAASLDNPDPKTGYPSLIDVDNWIDYHLLSTFARNSDSLDHSTYMSKARNGKLKHGPLWDYDRALGARRQETQRKPFEGWQQRDFTMEWWVTLFEQADFRQAYADRYQEFRDGPWSDVNLNGLIDRLAGEITSEAAARNYQRWPHPLAGDPPNWLGEVEELRRWVLGRVHWMDEQFLARPIVVVDGEEVAGDRPLSEDAIVTLQLSESAPVGAQIYYTLDGSDPRMSRFEAGVEDPAARISPAAIRYTDRSIRVADIRALTVRLFLPDSDRRLLLASQSIDWSGPVAYEPAAPTPQIGPVVISEVHYKPQAPSAAALELDPTLTAASLEFVELHNPTSTAVDLTGWQLRGGIDFSFDAGDRLDGDATVVVVPFDPETPADAARVAAFRQAYQVDSSVILVGPYNGKLNNGGERVQLVRVETAPEVAWVLHDEIDYDNRAPWPEIAGGQSRSLVRKAPNALGAVAASWTAAPPSPGTVDLAIVGDLDFDRDIDFDDIAGMVLALTDTRAYQDRFGVSASIGADLDRDGNVNDEDRELFLGLLGSR